MKGSSLQLCGYVLNSFAHISLCFHQILLYQDWADKFEHVCLIIQ